MILTLKNQHIITHKHKIPNKTYNIYTYYTLYMCICVYPSCVQEISPIRQFKWLVVCVCVCVECKLVYTKKAHTLTWASREIFKLTRSHILHIYTHSDLNIHIYILTYILYSITCIILYKIHKYYCL